MQVYNNCSYISVVHTVACIQTIYTQPCTNKVAIAVTCDCDYQCVYKQNGYSYMYACHTGRGYGDVSPYTYTGITVLYRFSHNLLQILLVNELAPHD